MLLLQWWLIFIVLGLGLLPAAAWLFRVFDDRGWLFAKVLSLAAGGYLVWALCVAGWIPFTRAAAILVTAALFAVVWGIFLLRVLRAARRAGVRAGQALGNCLSGVSFRIIFAEELLFFLLFLFWGYLIGFRPEASGTEKFMDFGFMAAMERSTVLPAKDMWYGTDPINYYYGGQYYAVYFARLAGTTSAYAYTLMRALVSAVTFVLPFSMVRQLQRRRFHKRTEQQSWARSLVPAAGGILAGLAAACAGNVHYLLYGLFGKVFRLSGYETYWFPESTRYIGHNPPTDDACIHEFPSYSFVLGDLHAHMVNLIFVLLFLGILTAWVLESGGKKERPQKALASPHLLLLAFLTGVFQWTNYWDYVIYLTVLLLGLVLRQLLLRGVPLSRKVLVVLGQTVICVVTGRLAARPFTSSFDMMVSEAAFTQNHTALYQFLVLWGLPIAVLLLFLLHFARRYLADAVPESSEMEKVPSLFMVMLGCCAFGLILIPEVVYVKDIYGDGYSRTNTMFKLTYQAFLMFGLFQGYALTELFIGAGKKLARAAAGVLRAVLLLTCGYLPYSIYCWFGNILDLSRSQGLDATAFISEDYPEDAEAIRWLEREVDGNPVVLEVYGDSYSTYCRVSAMTGLPTPEGWYVHEWLWRENTEAQNARIADIDAVYTSEDTDYVRSLLEKYNVEYIFVGSCEREAYQNLNESGLRALGEVVFGAAPGQGGTFIVRVQQHS